MISRFFSSDYSLTSNIALEDSKSVILEEEDKNKLKSQSFSDQQHAGMSEINSPSTIPLFEGTRFRSP